jgi:hypothetical protein
MGYGPFSSDSKSSSKYTALTDQAKGAVGKNSKIVESGAVEVAQSGTLLQPGASQSAINLATGSQYNPNFSSTTNITGVSTDDLKGLLAIQQAGLNASLQNFSGNLANQHAAETAATGGSGATLGEQIASSIGAVNVTAETKKKLVWLALAVGAFLLGWFLYKGKSS